MLRGEGDHSHFKRDRYMKLRCWAEYLRYPDMDSFALLGNKGFLAWLDYVAVEEKITDDQVDSVYMTDPPGWPQPDD